MAEKIKKKKAAKKAEPTRLQLMPQFVDNDPVFAKKHGYNPFLISRTQPGGNLSFKSDRYIETGDGYVCCIHLYGLPKTVRAFWLQQIMGMEGVFTTLDVAPADLKEIKKRLTRSITEVESRDNKNDEEQIESQNRYELLRNMLEGIITESEVVKMVHLRIYASNRNKNELDKTCRTIIEKLESEEYQAAIFLDETEPEYRALFQPYTTQIKEINHRKGLGCPASAVALGYPFNVERLDDPWGMYLGFTRTDGNVFLDTFRKTSQRLSYDGVVAGKKGSGKSTLLKMLMKMNAIIGNYIRVLDLTGEFTKLGVTLGGTVVYMDGSQYCLNPLEIFKSAEDDSVNFSRHLSKLNMLYSFLAPDSTNDIRNEFEEYCRLLYESTGIWSPESHAEGSQMTGLPPEAYPTFGDLLQLIRSDLYEDFASKQENTKLSESKRQRLESIELTVQSLVNAYPQMFNRHTSIPNLTNEQIVVFNVQNLANMKEGIFYAQLFNILSLMLDDMVTIGGNSKAEFEAQGSDKSCIKDLTKLMLILDESHEYINTKNPLVLDYMIEILRQDRKYFTGLWFASQSIRDFAPEEAGIDKLKTLFELAQYKFIMQHDSNALPLIAKVFANEITPSQVERIPQFIRGEAILLYGEDSLNMITDPSNEDLKLFEGGA